MYAAAALKPAAVRFVVVLAMLASSWGVRVNGGGSEGQDLLNASPDITWDTGDADNNLLPANTTVHIGRPALLQCRVRSPIAPTSIKWFRKQRPNEQSSSQPPAVDEPTDADASDDDATAPFHSVRRRVTFDGSVYESLAGGAGAGTAAALVERALPNDTYLSRLQLPAVRAADDGQTYVCVAINYRGYALRETRLTVIEGHDQITDDDDDELIATEDGEAQLFLLFLIPLALAAMPLLMWGCYLLCRSSEAAAAAARHEKQAAVASVRKYSLVCQNEVYV